MTGPFNRRRRSQAHDDTPSFAELTEQMKAAYQRSDLAESRRLRQVRHSIGEARAGEATKLAPPLGEVRFSDIGFDYYGFTAHYPKPDPDLKKGESGPPVMKPISGPEEYAPEYDDEQPEIVINPRFSIGHQFEDEHQALAALQQRWERDAEWQAMIPQ